MNIYYFLISLLVAILAVYICWFINRRARASRKEIKEVEERLNKKIDTVKDDLTILMQKQFVPYLKSLDEENDKLKKKTIKS